MRKREREILRNNEKEETKALHHFTRKKEIYEENIAKKEARKRKKYKRTKKTERKKVH